MKPDRAAGVVLAQDLMLHEIVTCCLRDTLPQVMEAVVVKLPVIFSASFSGQMSIVCVRTHYCLLRLNSSRTFEKRNH